jgi:uncharacterized membrane protein
MLTATLTLGKRVGSEDWAPLAADILAHRGSPLSIDVGGCTNIATPCLVTLVSAAKLWRKDGQSLSLAGFDATGGFARAAALAGLQRRDLETGEMME